MNVLVKILLIMVILTTLGNLVGQVVLWAPPVSDNDTATGGGETDSGEDKKPEISVNISTAVTPDADGKVPAGGVNITGDTASVVVPEGVQMENGAESLTFTVTSMEETTADVIKTSRDEILHSVDIHIAGVAKENTVPMNFALKAFFPKGLNENNVRLFHVENGETIEMTLVDAPANHNEFSYDPLTGDAVITIASFSEITAYADTNGPWDGETFDYTWYSADATELAIANASQFAAFRNIVDGGYYDKNWNWVEVAQDSFEGQKITLSADINLNSHLFDPIGWGYDNTAWNRNGAVGKVFKGHFDGNNHTIYGLYQNGWDLDPDKTNYSNYTYTNCGFGLFASALDATFENLNINGADIRVECVETGVLVGLAQGGCTFRNINILGCRAANYQRPVGGVVGEVSPKMVNGVAQEGDASKHTFDNVYVDSNTVVGSMWGDFDAPVGGVIGAYWDDAGKTTVKMTNVTVACRLDVYNDVTSTYQWYAYRRAGMLIGNTDHSEKNENGTNIASTKINGVDFLTCSDVTVYYGDWTEYHYCEFNEANPHWPWVRVEPGEYCEGYSNPRWGRPTDPNTGNPVTDSVHSHGDNEGHLQLIEFHQLYGGGQGVYGAETHPGVSEGIYTVTYMDRGKILRVDNVKDNTVAYTAPDIKTVISAAADGTEPAYWVDASGNQFTGLGAGRTADIIVYPKWPNEYAIRCLDTYGDVAYYNFVTDTDTSNYKEIATEINNALVTIQNEVDKDKKVMIIVWDIVTDNEETTYTSISDNDIQTFIEEQQKLSEEKRQDFVLEAVPQLQETSISLKPSYNEKTGELEYYYVDKVTQDDKNSNVVIPDYVGKYPVKEISDNAAAGFANLHAITIPNTVTSIGKNAFASGNSFGKGETITIYYQGTKADWLDNMKVQKDSGWDYGIGTGSRVFFLNKDGKVNTADGYLEVTSSGGFLGIGATYSWSEKTVDQSIINAHLKYCDCSVETTGDTSHIYVKENDDGTVTIMGRNEAGTPVNGEGAVIYLQESGSSWNRKYTLTDGTNTYYRYRPDHEYWVGVTIN